MIGPVPEEVIVTVFDESVFSEAVPNDTLVGFTVNSREASAGIDMDKSRNMIETDETSLALTVPERVGLIVAAEVGLALKFDRQFAE